VGSLVCPRDQGQVQGPYGRDECTRAVSFFGMTTSRTTYDDPAFAGAAVKRDTRELLGQVMRFGGSE
jgi:hypothetical protein